MSATNHTTNYSLPQFIGTDIPTWLTDVNGAMSTIDTAIKAAKDAGDQGITDAAAVANRTTTLESTVSGHTTSIGTNANSITALQTSVANVQSKVGSAALSTTAQNLSGAVNELFAMAGERLLWTNADPGSSFAGQTVSLDLSAYQFVMVLFEISPTDQETLSAIFYKGIDGLLLAVSLSAAVQHYFRRVSTSSTGVTFGDATIAGTGTNNTYCVPRYIIGIK